VQNAVVGVGTEWADVSSTGEQNAAACDMCSAGAWSSTDEHGIADYGEGSVGRGFP